MVKVSAEFGSPAELAELLEAIGLRLHGKNRIGGGENGYLWHLAETIRKAGRLALRANDDPEMLSLFGDAYDAGSLSLDEQTSHFIALLTKEAV